MTRALWSPEPLGAPSPLAGGPAARGLGMGCGVGALALVIFLAAVIVAGPWCARLGTFLVDMDAVPALAITGVALASTLPLLERARPRNGRARADLRVGLAFFGGVGFLGAVLLLSHPLIHRTYCSFGIGMGDSPAVMAGPMLALFLAVGGAMGAMFLGAVGSPLVTGQAGARRRAALLRGAAWASCVAVAGLVVLSAMTRARRPDPTLADYLAGLEDLGGSPAPRPEESSVELDGLLVRRTSGGIALARPGAPPLTPEERYTRSGSYYGATAEILRDRARGLIIVESDRARDTRVHGVFLERAAFRASDLTSIALDLDDLRDVTGPPPFWILAAAAGLVGALAFLLRGRLLLRVLARVELHRAGQADGAGRIVLDDGAVCAPEPTGDPVPVGPVVVIPIGALRAPTYRTAPTLGRVIVVPGTLADVAASLHAAEANRCLGALAVLSLTASPLVAAALRGLVWPLSALVR
jgi:hypothetical protein